MRIFRDFQSNLPSIPVLILPEKFSKNIGGITQYLFTLFAIISLRFFEKKDGETWMRFRRKILEFFWCSTWLRSVIVNRSESEENCWVKREIPRIIFLKICLSILWERYWKTMRNFRDFQSNLPFNSVLILSEKFSKNFGGITQCLFTLFAIISVRFFEKTDGETWMKFRRKIFWFLLKSNLDERENSLFFSCLDGEKEELKNVQFHLLPARVEATSELRNSVFQRGSEKV